MPSRLKTDRSDVVRREAPRLSRSQRGYTRRWYRVRARYLRTHPLCVRCGAVADVVDHILPMARGGEQYHTDNLQPLCTVCHNRKTATEDGGFGGRTTNRYRSTTGNRCVTAHFSRRGSNAGAS